jgi:hypothetical protein
MVMVTETARDFSALALPAEYVSQAGPFEKIQRTPQAVARIGQIATLSGRVLLSLVKTTTPELGLAVTQEAAA